MKARSRIAALTLAGLGVFWSGCDKSDLFVPSDGQMIITANPSNVTIPTGESSATSTITVQVFSAAGVPIPDVSVRLTTDGGTLLTDGRTQETNTNGFVYDELTMTLDDPTTIEILATSGTNSITTNVTRTTAGEPSASVVATPSGGQEVNGPVRFDGSGSSDPDPEDSITCYQWALDSDLDGEDRVIQNQTTSVLSDERFADAQTLNVTLRVSDSTEASSFCQVYDGPPGDPLIAAQSLFSANVGSVNNYEICAELTVSLGNDETRTTGTFTPTATVTDEDQFQLSYQWDCGNGQTGTGTTIDCEYTSTTGSPFTVDVTVTNQCDLTATDSQIIMVE